MNLSTSGVISGSPITPGTSTFTAKVTDSSTPTSSATRVLTLRALTSTTGLAVTTTALAPGLVGSAYSATLNASGGKGTYTWTRTTGSLPGGLKLSARGVISGIPNTGGTSSFTVNVTDGSKPKLSASQTLSITVNPMTITTTSLPTGRVAKIYSATITVSGGKGAHRWTRSAGSLPPGLKLSALGIISGKPTTIGSFTFTVKVTDGSKPALVASKSLTITVGQ
jgi:hypothetical protein